MQKPPKTGGHWGRNSHLARHIGVSAMCIWRWKRDPKLECPPSYVINNIEWNDLDEWDSWIRARAVSHINADKKKRKVA